MTTAQLITDDYFNNQNNEAAGDAATPARGAAVPPLDFTNIDRPRDGVDDRRAQTARTPGTATKRLRDLEEEQQSFFSYYKDYEGSRLVRAIYTVLLGGGGDDIYQGISLINLSHFPCVFSDGTKLDVEPVVRCGSVYVLGSRKSVDEVSTRLLGSGGRQTRFMSLTNYGIANVYVDLNRITSVGSLASIICACSYSMRSIQQYTGELQEGYSNIYILLDVLPNSGEAHSDVNHVMYRINGPSMGLAVFAALNGLNPLCMYTGYIRSVSPYFKASVNSGTESDPFTFEYNAADKTGSPNIMNFNRTYNRDDIIETVDQLPYKIRFCIENKITICIPHVGSLNQSLGELIRGMNMPNRESLTYLNGEGVTAQAVRHTQPRDVRSYGMSIYSYGHYLAGMTDVKAFMRVILCSTLTEAVISFSPGSPLLSLDGKFGNPVDMLHQAVADLFASFKQRVQKSNIRNAALKTQLDAIVDEASMEQFLNQRVAAVRERYEQWERQRGQRVARESEKAAQRKERAMAKASKPSKTAAKRYEKVTDKTVPKTRKASKTTTAKRDRLKNPGTLGVSKKKKE